MRSRNLAILITFVFLVSSIYPIVGNALSVNTTNYTNPKIDSDLMELVERNPDMYGRLIIYINKPTVDSRVNYLLSIGIPSDHIEYAFKLIPAVVVRTPYKQVNQIAGFRSVVRVSMEHVYNFLKNVDSVSAPVNITSDYLSPENITDVYDTWDQGYNGTGITIAIVDTGIDYAHPDLSGKIIGFKDYVKTDSGNSPSDSYDDNGHGTACAWLAAGSGYENGLKYRGMAPGAKLLSIKVLDSTGSGSDIDIAKGIEYAWEHGADIISLSLGAPYDVSSNNPFLDVVKSAIAHGTIVIAAAGNSGPLSMSIQSPGNIPEVISVGASEGSNAVAAFSSRGPVLIQNSSYYNMYTKPDVVSPGVLLFSGRSHTANVYEYPYANYSQYGPYYCWFSGTSAAAPIVSGITAILLQKQHNLTQTEVKALLTAGASDLGLDSMIQGSGLVNATKSLELIDELPAGLIVIQPRRYPTLPNGKMHIIVDKNFKPSNITIIATKPAHISFDISGNASRWVKLSALEYDIHVGLNFIPISMDFDRELPLSDVGDYTGWINVSESSKIVGQIYIELQNRIFGGRLGVDMWHQSASDPDSISSYSFFTSYLEDRGIIYYEDYQEITNVSLINSDFYLIMDTEAAYTDSEIAEIHKFVEDGGILLIFSEFFNTSSHMPSFGFSFYNEILAPYGISCEQYAIGDNPDGVIYGNDYVGAVDNDTLTQNVQNIYVLYGSTFHVDPSVAGAKGVIWADNERTHAIVAYAHKGKGMVIAVSDGSTMYDNVLSTASKKGADNLALLHNIANALNVSRPRIYSISVEPGKLHERNNISAYVFDDCDISEVSMYIIAPNRTVINLSLTESLGYKYSGSILLDAVGTWIIIVNATDVNGQSRMFITHYRLYSFQVPPSLIEVVIVSMSIAALIVIFEIYVMRKKPNTSDYGPLLEPL